MADVFDALTTKRPYKPAFPNEKALTIIRQGSGSHFDPQIVHGVHGESLTTSSKIQRDYADKNMPVAPAALRLQTATG